MDDLRELKAEIKALRCDIMVRRGEYNLMAAQLYVDERKLERMEMNVRQIEMLATRNPGC
jgi:hypothetical protein